MEHIQDALLRQDCTEDIAGEGSIAEEKAEEGSFVEEQGYIEDIGDFGDFGLEEEWGTYLGQSWCLEGHKGWLGGSQKDFVGKESCFGVGNEGPWGNIALVINFILLGSEKKFMNLFFGF